MHQEYTNFQQTDQPDQVEFLYFDSIVLSPVEHAHVQRKEQQKQSIILPLLVAILGIGLVQLVLLLVLFATPQQQQCWKQEKIKSLLHWPFP